ncbi:MAG: tetratricopeptide repeat protein [Magnetococcales bacterium]|nr:tetratricopeptide repeat protein [Magnetococcales bacterium]
MNTPPTAFDLLQSAQQLMVGQQYVQAVELCKKVLNQEPERADAWCLLGIIYQRQENLTGAVDCYRHALAYAPEDYAEPLNLLRHVKQSVFNQMEHYAALAMLVVQPEAYQQFDSTVQDGPFRGMLIHDYARTPASFTAAYEGTGKLFGHYESELHVWIQEAIQSNLYKAIANIGCFEGYYAVGFARSMPDVSVYAFDANEEVQRVCSRMALANGVADRVHVSGLCSGERLQQLAVEHGKILIFIDCEGCEEDLLDPELVPALVHCDMIVECHDSHDHPITPLLFNRFRTSHQIDSVEQGGRDPNKIAFLRNLSEHFRWNAMCERRPEVMHWLRLTVLSAPD